MLGERRVLVTGGAGFIGSHLCERLLERGDEVLCVDHGRLLRNSLDWAANEERPVTVSGPGVLDVTAWRQKESMTVHLVNLSNPMMMKGPLREVIPIAAQEVKVLLPHGKKARKVEIDRERKS